MSISALSSIKSHYMNLLLQKKSYFSVYLHKSIISMRTMGQTETILRPASMYHHRCYLNHPLFTSCPSPTIRHENLGTIASGSFYLKHLLRWIRPSIKCRHIHTHSTYEILPKLNKDYYKSFLSKRAPSKTGISCDALG